MRARSLAIVVVLIGAAGFVALFGLPWRWAPPRWHTVPAITIVGREDDPRLPAVRQAVDYWNRALAALPTPFRLGATTRVDGALPEGDLHDLSNRTLRGMWIRHHPRPFASFGGDLIIVLSDGDFISFSSRIGDRALVAIKTNTRAPLSLPNVLPNVIAHEIGHALGLEHNTDPTTLMCGRPAACRPVAFVSDVPRLFPLTPAETARLRALYPASWPAP